MKTKMTALTVAVVMMSVLVAPWAVADETPEKHHAKAIAAKEALLSSPALAESPEMMKGLVKALKGNGGILAANFDDKSKLLRVTFDPTKTTDKAILKTLGAKLPDLNMTKVQDTKWEPKNCGKCPSAHKCAGKDKEKTAPKNEG